MSAPGNPTWRRELAIGLLRTARREWPQMTILVACTSLAFWRGGYVAGIGWLMFAFTYVFAMWFAREARDGWEEAGKLARLLVGVAKGTHEVKIESEKKQ